MGQQSSIGIVGTPRIALAITHKKNEKKIFFFHFFVNVQKSERAAQAQRSGDNARYEQK
jgi:hypothetical protein